MIKIIGNFQKGASIINKLHSKKTLSAFIIIIILSLLPGTFISFALFVNAAIHDIKIQNIRNSLPSTDLSQVRIAGHTLGQYIENWSAEKSISYAICENGDEFSEDIFAANSDSPIVCTGMGYPLVKYSWSEDIIETWNMFTIHNEPIPNCDIAFEKLGINRLTIDNWRTAYSYVVYLDHQNGLELRFEYFKGEIRSIFMTRPDKRAPIEFIMKQSKLYKDRYYTKLDGNRVVDSFYIKMVLNSINGNFRYKEFLSPISAYFSIPPYFALWTFPLVWAIYKRRLTQFVIMAIWYPLWCFLGWLSFLAQQ